MDSPISNDAAPDEYEYPDVPRRKKMFLRRRICLPDLKEAGPFDVICAKGKIAANHAGNKWLRQLAYQHLNRYNNARTKHEKTQIMSTIVECVRSASVHGGFIKKDLKTGLWWEVGDLAAREKVGFLLRDALCNKFKYKSNKHFRLLQKKQKKSETEAAAALHAIDPSPDPASTLGCKLHPTAGETSVGKLGTNGHPTWPKLGESSCFPFQSTSTIDTILAMSVATGGPGLFEPNHLANVSNGGNSHHVAQIRDSTALQHICMTARKSLQPVQTSPELAVSPTHRDLPGAYQRPLAPIIMMDGAVVRMPVLNQYQPPQFLLSDYKADSASREQAVDVVIPLTCQSQCEEESNRQAPVHDKFCIDSALAEAMDNVLAPADPDALRAFSERRLMKWTQTQNKQKRIS